jgi:hypothetical protein
VEIKDAAVEPAPSGGAVFEIVTRERRHFFRATDMEEMKLWINDLLRSVDLAESASSSQVTVLQTYRLFVQLINDIIIMLLLLQL